MTISWKVSQAKSAISAITTDNLEDQKPKASGAVDAVGGIGKQIVGHAREAVWNDSSIQNGINKAQNELEALWTVKDNFLSTLDTLRRDLEEAHNRFQNALTDAEQTFNDSFSSTRDEMNGTISAIESESNANKGLHIKIGDLAS